MPTFDFNFELSTLVTGAIKVVAILVGTCLLQWVLRKLVPRVMTASIPKIREETPDQLALRSKSLSEVIVRSGSVILWVLAILMMVSVLGVNIAPILASLGVASIAVGFAAQYIIRDYLNGFLIAFEDWYRVGEVVNIAGIGGLVVGMSLRRTTLRDLNGTMHVIPNSKVEIGSNLTRDWARINLDVTVAYKEDLDRVIKVSNEVCEELKDDPQWGQDLLTTPKVLRVNDLGDHGVQLKILGDTKPIKQWGLMGELRKRLKTRYDREGIEIPWPHTKLYLGDIKELQAAFNLGRRSAN